MMRTKLTLVAASLATLMMTTAHAAPPPAEADLSISARVVPSAEVCTLDLSNNGTADYGDIRASTLSATSPTSLIIKVIEYTISCTSPTKVSLSIVDNRVGTATALRGDPSESFGLGQANGVNIGSNQYQITPVGLRVNNAPGGLVDTSNGGSRWGASGGDPMRHVPGYAWSFASNQGDPAPVPVTNVVGDFEVRTNIAPTSSFDITQVINLDGFATLTLNYI